MKRDFLFDIASYAEFPVYICILYIDGIPIGRPCAQCLGALLRAQWWYTITLGNDFLLICNANTVPFLPLTLPSDISIRIFSSDVEIKSMIRTPTTRVRHTPFVISIKKRVFSKTQAYPCIWYNVYCHVLSIRHYLCPWIEHVRVFRWEFVLALRSYHCQSQLLFRTRYICIYLFYSSIYPLALRKVQCTF